jgi:hypothetical protein
MWVITRNPLDYPPNMFVARKWTWHDEVRDMLPTTQTIAVEDITSLRRTLVEEYGMSLAIDRAPDDDPTVLETWI